MTPLRLLQAFGAGAVAFAASACGGNTDTPRPEPLSFCRPVEPLSDYPDPGSGPVDCHALDGYEVLLIDDFEAGSASIGWYVDNDRTALSDPMPDTDPPPSAPIRGGRCVGTLASAVNPPMRCADRFTPRGECEEVLDVESRSAFHMVTGLLSADGGKLGRDLPKRGCITPDPTDPSTLCPFGPAPPETGPCSTAQGPTAPPLGCSGYDMSGWDGVVLWARVGPGSQATVKVRTSDTGTDEKGCICNPYTNENDTSDGCDKYVKFVSLDQDYRAYLVPFTEMQQGGWGLRSPGLDTSNLFTIAVEFGRGAWDLWIDDIGFYRRKP